MSPLGAEAIRGALISENDKLADLARETDPQTPIPSCPGWTLTELTKHVGRGHLWAATMVADRMSTPLAPKEVPNGKPPADADGADRWLRESAQTVVNNVDATGAETPIWTFIGPKPAEWWIRRRLHEATVHGADLTLALGREVDMAPEIAADGLSEWFALWRGPGRGQGPLLAEGDTVRLHATDSALGDGADWTIRSSGEGIDFEESQDARESAVTVTGSVVDLFMVMLRRVATDDPRLTITGDPAVLVNLLARTPF